MTTTSTDSSRWVGVGYSDDHDSNAAGTAAADAALRDADPRLMVVFCSDSYDLQALLAAINERSGGVPLIGCSTAGQIGPRGPGDSSVVVTALGGSGFRPLGLSRRSAEEGVRLVAGADFDNRSLSLIAEVPQDGLAWFMEGDEESVLGATDHACAEAIDAIGDRAPLGLLTFDCAARREVLGDEGISREVERVTRQADGAPVAGFYSYGEIARTSGVSGFHNQTIVVLAVS